MLSEDDYVNFHRIVRANRHSPDDFEISTMDNFEKSEKYHIEVTEISVKNLQSDIIVNYRSGFGSYWLQKFEEDLRGGLYQ